MIELLFFILFIIICTISAGGEVFTGKNIMDHEQEIKSLHKVLNKDKDDHI